MKFSCALGRSLSNIHRPCQTKESGACIACIQLHVTTLNVHGEYMRKRMNIMKMLSLSTSQKVVLKRLKKTPARPRSSIGLFHITKQCACLYTGRYHITFVFALTCGRTKTIRIPYVWTRIFSKTEKNLRSQKYSHTCGQGLRATVIYLYQPDRIIYCEIN